ncbi:MAG: hypothetical protein RR739_09195 [Clostridia bacterium]
MKKRLWFCLKLFKSIRGRMILLWIQVLILSFSLNFCLIHPLSTINGYHVYDKLGLADVGLFTVGYQYIEWVDKETSPAYNQLLSALSEMCEIGVINDCFAILPEFPHDAMSLTIYPQSFVERVALPIPDNPTVLRGAYRADSLPLVLDSRLKGVYDIEQEIPIVINGDQYPAHVVGFMGGTNEHFGVPYASGSPTLDNLIRSGDQMYSLLTVESVLLPRNLANKAGSALYVFPPQGKRIDPYLPIWRHEVESKWLGNIHTLQSMRDDQFKTELIGSGFELYLVCVWCIVLFLSGLQGFFTYIMTRLHRQLAVCRMLGLNRWQWRVMMLALVFLPVLICAMSGWFLANNLGFELINRTSYLLAFGTALFALVTMFPAIILELRAWRKNATEFHHREARK